MTRKPLYLALAAQMLTASSAFADDKVIVKKGELLPNRVYQMTWICYCLMPCVLIPKTRVLN